ncbi:MAG: Gfo/Idh/MocA family oxidoreductase [Phycisphaerae bacterium]|nr:Gfo/Idh/MocA family oxidoreductase [Phycisphaerae bacterium]
MIGLDTSHVKAFTEIFNNAKAPDPLAKCRVVAAFKGGSPDIPSSADRVDGYTKLLAEKHGVKLYETIEEMCKNVDGVMLESVDGRPHLKQARPVIKAGLPLFIDKPVAGSLADVIEIYRLAKEGGVPVWGGSSLRFDSNVVKAAEKAKQGGVKKVIAWSPCHKEPHHPDLFWYGVHGVEILFTVMGTGCEKVVRKEGTEIVTGTWSDGRIGVFDPTRKNYGVEVITADGKTEMPSKGDFYKGQMKAISDFFVTGKVPVRPEETVEMYAFMEAADESKRQGYKEVSIAEVMAKARKAAGK